MDSTETIELLQDGSICEIITKIRVDDDGTEHHIKTTKKTKSDGDCIITTEFYSVISEQELAKLCLAAFMNNGKAETEIQNYFEPNVKSINKVSLNTCMGI